MNNNQIGTVTHNAGHRALLAMFTGSNGQMLRNDEISMITNTDADSCFQNVSGGVVNDIKIYAVFEWPSIANSGFIPASAVPIV